MPFLQLLFSVDSVNEKVIDFIIHQFLCVVSVRETFVDMEFMLSHPPSKVSSHSCVKSGIVFIRKDVDYSLERHYGVSFRVGDRGSDARDEAKRPVYSPMCAFKYSFLTNLMS